ATGGADGVRLWDAMRGTELVRLAKLPEVHSVAFSPDGDTLAVGDDSGSVQLWDRAGGRMRGELEFEGVGDADWVAFSPDGKTLARGGRGEFALGDVASGKVTARRAGLVAAFSPDGKALAVGIGFVLGFVNPRTGWGKPTYAGHTEPLRALAFSPDGKTL